MIFAILTLLTALGLATIAGWFAIVGIMTIYAGAPMAGLILGCGIETAKLVTVSWLYRNWTHAKWSLKAPLIYFTLAIMLATSMGVYGFLTKSHLEQGASTIDNSAKVVRLEEQIAREKTIIADSQKVIDQLDATINSYLGKDRADRSVYIKRRQAAERNQLREDIETAQKRIDELSQERFLLQSEVRKLELEVGPIRYIAALWYGSEGTSEQHIEAAVRMFTMLIVSTLDPAAIILLIAANHSFMRRRNEKDKSNPPSIPPAPSGHPARSSLGTRPISDQGNYNENKENKEQPEQVPWEQQNENMDKGLVGRINEGSALPEILAPFPEINIEKLNEEKISSESGSNKMAQASSDVFTKSTPFSWQQEHTSENNIAYFPQSARSRLSPAESDAETVHEIIDSESGVAEHREMPLTVEKSPWTSQNDMLGLIVGSSPHFVPQKVNEDEQEISNTDNVEELNTTWISRLRSSTPKTLSWLAEFRNTNGK